MSAYLQEDRALFVAADIEVAIHRYEHPVYPQAFPPFRSRASAIDALLNLGPIDALACLRSGRRRRTAFQQ